jgi:hypothetical protein
MLAARFFILLLTSLASHAWVVDALLQIIEYCRIHFCFFTGGKREHAHAQQQGSRNRITAFHRVFSNQAPLRAVSFVAVRGVR